MCTVNSSQDDLEFISSFCTEESSQANLAVICRFVTRMTPLQWGATHSMIRCKTMCGDSVRKTGRHIKKATKQQQTKYKGNNEQQLTNSHITL